MKNKFLILSTLSLGWILMMSNSINVVANRGDKTGSPVQSGSSQCGGSCHGGGSMTTPTISVSLLDASNASVTEYTPGETYTIKTEVSSNASAYGFQMVALLNNNSNAGVSTASSSNVQIETLNSRKYSSHNGGASANGVFETTWVAPASGEGNVTFYASGVAVNLSGNFAGDKPTSPTSLLVTEKDADTGGGGTGGGTVGVDQADDMKLAIFPNPVINNLNIVNVSIKEVRVYSLSGEKIVVSNQKTIDLSNLHSGVYIIKILKNNGDSIFKKIIKK